MKVNKELIEKYHRQECTPAEADAVEEWLFADTSDELLELPDGASKPALKQEMWAQISGTIPENDTMGKVKHRLFNRQFWTGAVAASVVLVAAMVGIYFFNQKSRQQPQLVSVDNASSQAIKHIQYAGYDMELGPKTSARIYSKQGIIRFTGSIVLQPKEDIELSFGKTQQKMVFKAGQTYILFNDANGNGKVVIVNEKNLMDIPPVLQKKISSEFNI